MRRGFLAAFCKISGPRVAHALSWECGAALGPAHNAIVVCVRPAGVRRSSGPADSEGLRLSAFGAPGFSVDDGAAGQVVKAR